MTWLSWHVAVRSSQYREGVIIRDATVADWPAIYPFFRSIVDAGETYAYPNDLSQDGARPLWMEAPPGRTIVAVDDIGDVLGSAKMGPNRPGRGSHIATASFMVSPAARGKGVGRALGENAVDWARSAGYDGMQFNAVVETNTAAISLWKSLGFEILTTVPGAFDHARHGKVGLHVMFQAFSAGR